MIFITELIAGNSYRYATPAGIINVDYIGPLASLDGWFNFKVKSTCHTSRQNTPGISIGRDDDGDDEIISISGPSVWKDLYPASPSSSTVSSQQSTVENEKISPEVAADGAPAIAYMPGETDFFSNRPLTANCSLLTDSAYMAAKTDLNLNPAEIFKGKNVVVSGVYERYPVRKELKDLIKSMGADVRQAVSGTTNILVVGDKFGPKKMEKALELMDQGYNIQIIEENQLYRILGTQADITPPLEKKPETGKRKPRKKERLIPLTNGRMWYPQPR